MGNPTVLVVDDEFLIRWSLKEHLRDAGYRAVEAIDGKSALEHFRTRRDGIGLVLLDLRLPDMDGVAVLRHIKQADPSCAIVMMSAHGTPEKREEAKAAGACCFIDKPFDYAQMMRRVGEILRAN